MNLLDFSKMKKVATDGKTTTFEHEKGHRMVILHSALPKIQQEQIRRLALYKGGRVKNFDDGTPDGPIKKDDDKTVDDSASKSPPVPDAPPAQSPASHDTHITINAAPAAPAAPVTAGQTQVAPAPAQPNLLLPDKTLNAPAAVNLQQKAIGEQVPVTAAASQAAAANEQSYLAKQQEIAKKQAQNFNEIKKHTDEFNDYIKTNPINPRAYQENQTAAQKSQTAIGLFLGGLGGGGTSNVALDFLNKQIDRDIDAQKKNADNRNTVWGAYQHLYEDGNISTNLAKVSANDILVHQTNLAAAKLGTAQALQHAHELQAQKAIENNQLLLDSAGRLGTIQTGPTPTHRLSTSVSSKSKVGGAQYTNTKTTLYGSKEGAGENSILFPDASLDAVKYNPTAKQDYDKVKEQFTNAQQAEKGLKSIDGLFDRMTQSGAEGSYGGYFHRQIAPSIDHVPVIGGVFKGLEKAATDTQDTRDYESAKTGLFKTIRAALGPGTGDGAIEKVVDANSPERGDDETAVQRKKKTIKEFIIQNTPTTSLEQYKLAPKR